MWVGGSAGWNADLEHLNLDGGDGILDPFADLGVAALPDWVVVFAGAEEGGWRVDVALVEDGVDGDGEEVAECGDDGGVGVEGRFPGGIGGHGTLSVGGFSLWCAL